ncbi:MAG TPA: (d)CMP kinase [Arenicellales bacterium]|nr:(d)CMP kinase [Arenicellales bacterium]HJL56052.1 (d)CMP kinase [Arenicellales bacterium]
MIQDSGLKVPVVAIDGPSGTGKGTVAAEVAGRLGWHVLDSGALYRAFAYAARIKGVNPDDFQEAVDIDVDSQITFQSSADEVRIILAGEDVTDAVRGEEGGRAASAYAAIPAVRSILLARQRAARKLPGLVADGRDMGTVVFSDADAKIFLDASPKVRAERRYKQLKEKGFDVNLARLEKEIAERDRKDATRAESPLIPAEDAFRVDTSHKSIDEVVEQVMVFVHSCLRNSTN